MEKVLLHSCCGPCAIHPIDELRRMGFEPVAYFFNPNVHPGGERSLRLQALKAVCEARGVELISEPDGGTEGFIKEAGADPRPGVRCVACYRIRLRKAAAKASSTGLGRFTSTLLVSPYQLHDEVKAAGLRAASSRGADFIYVDFRPGFREGQRAAKKLGIYRQKYCGCKWSLSERESAACKGSRGST